MSHKRYDSAMAIVQHSKASTFWRFDGVSSRVELGATDSALLMIGAGERVLLQCLLSSINLHCYSLLNHLKYVYSGSFFIVVLVLVYFFLIEFSYYISF